MPKLAGTTSPVAVMPVLPIAVELFTDAVGHVTKGEKIRGAVESDSVCEIEAFAGLDLFEDGNEPAVFEDGFHVHFV